MQTEKCANITKLKKINTRNPAFLRRNLPFGMGTILLAMVLCNSFNLYTVVPGTKIKKKHKTKLI